MAIFILENGSDTEGLPTRDAFWRRTSRSEIGSFTINYQDDLRMPGIRPSLAASRKHARHIPKSRIKARLRPQRKQRRTTRDLNFGGLLERATVDFLAIVLLVLPVTRELRLWGYASPLCLIS